MYEDQDNSVKDLSVLLNTAGSNDQVGALRWGSAGGFFSFSLSSQLHQQLEDSSHSGGSYSRLKVKALWNCTAPAGGTRSTRTGRWRVKELTWSPVPAKWIHTGLFFCHLLGTINWNLKQHTHCEDPLGNQSTQTHHESALAPYLALWNSIEGRYGCSSWLMFLFI